MCKDPLTIQEIEDYLEGNLSPEYLAEFERRLLGDEKATQELMQLKKVIEGVKGYVCI
jgi:anti-sigma factor RsiW